MGALETVASDDANRVSWLLVFVLAVAVAVGVVRGEAVWAVFLVGTLGILLVPPAVVRTVDANSERTTLTPEPQFAFILVFVMAFGVLWEIIEFGTEQIAKLLGGEAVLVQYGLDDVINDLVFNQVGAIVVAGVGRGPAERGGRGGRGGSGRLSFRVPTRGATPTPDPKRTTDLWNSPCYSRSCVTNTSSSPSKRA